jgi:hypothetical protein
VNVTTVQKVGIAAVGVVIAGLAYSAVKGVRTPGDDEDRPPIVVKSGSVEIFSGDPDSTDPAERDGPEWTDKSNKAGEWQPKQPQGKSGKWLLVEAEGGTDCPSYGLTKVVRIELGSASYSISFKARHGGTAYAPQITDNQPNEESKKLTLDTTNNRRLFNDGTDPVVVKFEPRKGTTVTCKAPAKLTVWPF